VGVGAAMSSTSVLRVGTPIRRTAEAAFLAFGWCAHKQKRKEKLKKKKVRFGNLTCWQ